MGININFRKFTLTKAWRTVVKISLRNVLPLFLFCVLSLYFIVLYLDSVIILLSLCHFRKTGGPEHKDRILDCDHNMLFLSYYVFNLVKNMFEHLWYRTNDVLFHSAEIKG